MVFMRKIFAFVMLILACASVNAQSVTLTFTGMGKGGIVTEEIPQQIDSLLVRNLSRSWEQMLYYPDTVFIMDVLDVPMIDVLQSGLSQNVPNPFDCVTEVDLNLPEKDAVSLQVIDANGRVYLEYNANLEAGRSRFEITLAVPQTYFLTASTSTQKYTVKMVNLGSCGVNKIALKSSSADVVSSKALSENDFDRGDEMEYYAYTTYRDIVFNGSVLNIQNGSEDIVIHFNIPYCDRSVNIQYESACESYTWPHNGETYYETNHNAARATLHSVAGCDSIVLLDVTIGHPVQTDTYITACQSINWNGQVCSQTGDYIADLISSTGCDSTVTLHFTRRNGITNEFFETDCESFTWNGETYTESGDYQQTFVTEYGCDSVVTLHFTNTSDETIDERFACGQYTWSANGVTYYESTNTATCTLTNRFGCDSVVTLHLTLGYPSSSVVTATACMEFDYYGQIYTHSGSFTQTVGNVSGCDSVVTLNLTITNSVEEDLHESACESFYYNNHNYTSSGDYDVHFSTPTGCDSIVHLHLVISHNTNAFDTVTACESYEWHGQTYTASGNYNYTMQNTQGCDSICHLHLTINHNQATEKTIYACDRYVFDSEEVTTTSDFYRTYEDVNGCDSVVTYHIIIKHNEQTEFSQYACGSYTWNGHTYTQSGDYQQHFVSVAGCDSLVTMHLYLGTPNYGITDVQSACDTYEWEGTTYTASGSYEKTLTNIYGCDSVVTLELTVHYSNILTDVQEACDSYEWEGDVYTTSGSYTKTLQNVYGCDSVVILHLTVRYGTSSEFSDTSCGPYTWNGQTYMSTGDHVQILPAQNGCDSVVTLHLVYHEMVTDSRDGNVYCTMEYGSQVWMTENMRYLPQIDNSRSYSDPKYYVYGYPLSSSSSANLEVARANPNYIVYGTLYNYSAAMTACPSGWHLPSRAEWNQLLTYLGTQPDYYCGDVTENVAKALASTELWTEDTGETECSVGNDPSLNNASGFNGLPGGYLNMPSATGSLNAYELGIEANWWSSDVSGTQSAYYYQMSNDSPSLGVKTKYKYTGFSVRCVKDAE